MEQSSIQRFYSREVKGQDSGCSNTQPPNLKEDDGFTSLEVANSSQLTELGPWHPQQEYNETDIAELMTGPSHVTISGRVVNFYMKNEKGKLHPRPSGYFKMLIKDDTGVISVKLYFAKVAFPIRLGQVVTVWTTHINASDPSSISLNNQYLHVNLFPEGDRSCYFTVDSECENSDVFRTPLDYTPGVSLPSLMTLKTLVEGGHEIPDAKVLVCIKSIGQRKNVTSSKPPYATHSKTHILVSDDTLTASLTLWNCLSHPPSSWKPTSTILLLTKPTLTTSSPTHSPSHPPYLCISPISLLETDPAMPDAIWLRDRTQALSKKEHPNPPFPEGIFDAHEAVTAQVRVFFRFSELEEWAAADPDGTVLAWTSVVVADMGLARMHAAGKLCSGLCCNLAVYANSTKAKCRHCEKELTLRLNPRTIGTLSDESGSLNSSKTIFSDTAWEQLLGRSAEQLCAETPAALKSLEHRMLFLRVTVLMGWKAEVGRLVVLWVGS